MAFEIMYKSRTLHFKKVEIMRVQSTITRIKEIQEKYWVFFYKEENKKPGIA